MQPGSRIPKKSYNSTLSFEKSIAFRSVVTNSTLGGKLLECIRSCASSHCGARYQRSGDLSCSWLCEKGNASLHIGRIHIFCDSAIYSHCLWIRMAVLAVHSRTNQDCVRVNMEQRLWMNRIS